MNPSSTRIAVFHGVRLLLQENGRLPLAAPAGSTDPPFGPLDARIPGLDGPEMRVVEWPEDLEPPDALVAHSLRAAFPLLGEEAGLVGRAAHLLEWRRTHRFCGSCGESNTLGGDGRTLVCPSCGLISFPRLAPAIIVLVHDGDRAMLGRAHRYPSGMYSTLAGFVEPGETLEAAVAREVFEESGVEVTDVEYRGSQHWPFPHSLMVGFRARWTGGDPRPLDGELEDVRWFDRDNLPTIPPAVSIAHHLIRDWADD